MRRIVDYVIMGIMTMCLLSACHEKDNDESSPLVGNWKQSGSYLYGDYTVPDDDNAYYLKFTNTEITKYTSISEKCEEIFSLSYYIENDRLWYDTGSRKFTNNETITFSGDNLRITEEDGNYEDYVRISALPTD